MARVICPVGISRMWAWSDASREPSAPSWMRELRLCWTSATLWIFMKGTCSFSERVRTVRTDGELELEQQLVGGHPLGVARPPVLPADLAELARPVGQDERAAAVAGVRVGGPLGLVEAG